MVGAGFPPVLEDHFEAPAGRVLELGKELPAPGRAELLDGKPAGAEQQRPDRVFHIARLFKAGGGGGLRSRERRRGNEESAQDGGPDSPKDLVSASRMPPGSGRAFIVRIGRSRRP